MFDLEKIKNPGKEYRAIPFWSLNGKLTKKELKRQILNMKKMGFGGAFLHSRTGLETEYLSEEWMDLLEYCKNILIEQDMYVYLYDEDRYPSGTCGGFVTKKKEFKEKSMNYFEVVDFNNFKRPDDFLALFAVKLGEHNKCISYRKIDNFNCIKDNEKVFCFYVYYMPDDPFYNGNCMVDMMNKEATNAFISSTHEKYKEKFGSLFGSDIKGIFTDEPCRGPMFTGFSHISPNSEKLIPYTYKLFDEFYKRRGYRLEEKLPELWFGLEDNIFCKTTYDYVEIVQELFLENFAKPYRDWCHKNNLIFTGHILHEDNLAAQTTMSGSMMRFYEYFDYPGMDNLGSESYWYNVPALVRSVVNQLGKEYSLDELYGVSGWPMKLEDYKRIGDWQSAGGITLRVPHLCWYTMKGEAKRDCPASIFHQSSWYLDYKNVEDYFARLTFMLKNGTILTDIAIINPIESAWGIVNQDSYLCFCAAKEENYVRLEKEYAELYKGLILNGFSADYIDEGLFEKYGFVNGAVFACGKMNYKTILLNGNINLRSSTLHALKMFISNGGKVIIVGNMPTYLEGNKHDFKEELSGAIHIEFNIDKVVSLLEKGIVKTSSSNVIVEKRYFDDDLFVFLLNRQDIKETVKICVKTDKKPSIVNLRTGELEKVFYSFRNGEVIIDKEFAPNEEFALYFASEQLGKNIKKYEVDNEIVINEFSYKLLEDNFLVLNKCKLYFDNEFIAENYSIYTDIELRKKLGLPIRGNQMLQPWFQEKFFKKANKKKYGVVRLHYEFKVDDLPNDAKFMFEPQQNEKIFLNGKEIELTKLSQSKIDCCFFTVQVNELLFKKDVNYLDVIFDYYYNSNIEDHYLLGKFGVSQKNGLDGIRKLPAKLKSDNINKQGFPYYGGKVLLTKEIENGFYEVSFEKMSEASVIVNGVPVLFPPYKEMVTVKDNKLEIEIAYTRENTFGIISVGNSIQGIKDQFLDRVVLRKIK